MGWLRRRHDLGLRPLSELHDEFSARSRADEMLAEAALELARRECMHAVRTARGL